MYGCYITMHRFIWVVWVLYVRCAVAMWLLMQLECEFAILTSQIYSNICGSDYRCCIRNRPSYRIHLREEGASAALG